MVRLDASLEDRYCAAIERGGRPRLAPLREQEGEVVQRRREVGVVGSEQLLEQQESLAIQPLRFVEPAAPEQQRGELADVERDLVVLRAESLLEDDDRLAEERLGFLVLSARVEHGRERGGVGGDGRMVVAQRAAAKFDGAARQRFGGSVIAACVGEAAEVVEERCQVRMVGLELALHDRERAAVEPLGLVQLADELEGDREIVGDRGLVEGVRLSLRERVAVPLFGLLVPAECPRQRGTVGEREHAERRSRFACQQLGKRDRLLENLFGRVIGAAVDARAAEQE